MDSSVCFSTRIEENHSPIELYNGDQNCNSENISNNDVYQCSALYYKSGKTKSKITYCSIISNYACDSRCIYIEYGSSYEISTCNIINNTQISSELIVFDKETEVKYCSITNNNCPCLFGFPQRVTLTIIRTYFNGNPTANGSGELNTPDISTNMFENDLSLVDCNNLLKKYKVTQNERIYSHFMSIVCFSFNFIYHKK